MDLEKSPGKTGEENQAVLDLHLSWSGSEHRGVCVHV